MKRKTSFSLSSEALVILEELAKKYGISKTAILELVLRDKAKEEGIKWQAKQKSNQ